MAVFPDKAKTIISGRSFGATSDKCDREEETGKSEDPFQINDVPCDEISN